MLRSAAIRYFKSRLSVDSFHKIRLATGSASNCLWNGLRPRDLDSELLEWRDYWRVRSPLRSMDVAFDDDRINTDLRSRAATDRAEYIYHIPQVSAIEPRFGYVILPPAGIVWESVTQTNFLVAPHRCVDLGCVPSPLQYALRPRARMLREPRVISLRTLHENNYWHFLHDVLGKIALFAAHDVPEDWPVVVGRNLYQAAFFQEALQRGLLRGRRIICQEDFFIEAGEVIFGTSMAHERRYFEEALRLIDAPAPDMSKERRVYLTRGRNRQRFIENEPQIRDLCAEFGFEAVDTDQLSLAEQMELFGSIRFLVGIHGAGLTNMIFRRDCPLSLLELFGPDYIAPHYAWLAQDFGHFYDPLVGEPAPAFPGGFHVDPARLREKIVRLLDT